MLCMYLGDPKKDVNAVEDFLQVVLAAYVITAAATILGTEPNKLLSTQKTYARPVVSVTMLARSICSQYSDLSRMVKEIPPNEDKVLEHTKDLMTLLLSWYHYRDITREGDGDRFLEFTPVLLRLFKASKKKNYAIETCLMMLQYHYLMSDRMKTQLLYSRYINTNAIKGKNIGCDLHMEHINRYAWKAIAHHISKRHLSFHSSET